MTTGVGQGSMQALRKFSTPPLSPRQWRYVRAAIFAVLLLALGYATLSPDGVTQARANAQTDECVNPLGSITGSQTYSGTWNGDCLSEKDAPDGEGAGYARFYTFTLERRSNVTVELTASGEGHIGESIAIPFLYMMEGHGKGGSVLEAESGAAPFLTLDSSVTVALNEGNYTIEATTYGAGRSGSFTLAVDVEAVDDDTESGSIPERKPATGDANEDIDDDESEAGVYTWRDGDRTLRVRLVSDSTAGTQAARSLSKEDRTSSEQSAEEAPVFRSEPGGNLMTLPGGVLMVLDSSWEQEAIDDFFTENEIDASLVSELDFLDNAFLIETSPGFASLDLANKLAALEGVQISSPNWRSEIEISQETETVVEDDHGDSTDTATELPLNTAVHGVIGEEGDEDFFKVVITESTLVEIRHPPYPVGGSAWNSRRVTILNSDGSEWSWRWGDGMDFVHEVRLAAGTYYLKVFNEAYFDDSTGYDVYVRTIADHPDTVDSATVITMDDPSNTDTHRSSKVTADFHSETDVDVFRLELAEEEEVLVSLATHGLIGTIGSTSPYTVVTLEVLDSEGTPLRRRLLGYNTKVGQYSLKAGTYYLRFSPYPYIGNVKNDDNLVPYTFRVRENSDYVEFLESCGAISSNYDDPLYGCQSHLNDINVAGAWSVTKGEGVNVAIADGAKSFAHEDLRDNEDTTRHHNYVNSLVDADPREDLARHGIAVAGIIGARDNDKGVRGVAPRATVYGYNLVLDNTLSNALDALTRNRDITAVHNNSWGFRNSAGAYIISQLWTAALESGVNTGNGGKGVFYVFSAGNRHERGQHVGLHEGKNFYAQTTVCAVDSDGRRASSSETGYALWVCAPLARVTTDTWDLYMGGFGGTSSTAPVVSGVAALVRGANTDLTWRDVKLILAESASKNDSSNAGWETGAAKYASGSGNYHYNPEYGFGVVDAAAAVALASNWTRLPALEETTTAVTVDAPEYRIPDATVNGEAAPLTSTLSISSDIDFTEFIEVNIDLHHQSFRDLEILLQSPSGAVSKLTVPHDEKARSLAGTYIGNVIRLGTARHLGEDPNGEWTLTVRDHYPTDFGHVWEWGITVYGHRGRSTTTSAPTITGATTLTVAEGTTAVTTLTATDEDTAAAGLTWSIPSESAGGADADDFTITASGALSFTTAKDFEAPDDADTDGTYLVSVQVSDGTATDTADLTVTLTNVNEAPTANAGSDQDNIEQGSTVIISGSGSDPDSGDTLSYSWTQTSGNTVSLSDSSSATTTFTAPTGLTADATLIFTLRVTDDGGLYDEDRISVTVAAPDEVVLSSDATLSSLTLSGIDIGTFSSETTFYSASVEYGVLSTTVRATPNDDGASVIIADHNGVTHGTRYPISLSTGSNSVRVTVTAEDGVTTKVYRVTVSRAASVVTGPSLFTYRENGTAALHTFRATDSEGDDITWSLSGADEDDFTIEENGRLSFTTPPDYESPTDADSDNMYEVTVVARDAVANLGTLEVTVTVTEVNEGPDISRIGSAPASVPENYDPVLVLARYSATDPEDSGASISNWRTSGTDGGDFVISQQGELRFRHTPDYENPADSDEDNVYKVTVQVSDGSVYGDFDEIITVAQVDEPPVITTASSSATDLKQEENSTAGLYTYRATDPERTELTWSVGGADAHQFTINEDGMFSFRKLNPPDFEQPTDSDEDNVYEVMIEATDDGFNTGSLFVTVTVTNDDEGVEPTISTRRPSTTYRENGTSDVHTFRASEPQGGSIVWSLQGGRQG